MARGPRWTTWAGRWGLTGGRRESPVDVGRLSAARVIDGAGGEEGREEAVTQQAWSRLPMEKPTIMPAAKELHIIIPADSFAEQLGQSELTRTFRVPGFRPIAQFHEQPRRIFRDDRSSSRRCTELRIGKPSRSSSRATTSAARSRDEDVRIAKGSLRCIGRAGERRGARASDAVGLADKGVDVAVHLRPPPVTTPSRVLDSAADSNKLSGPADRRQPICAGPNRRRTDGAVRVSVTASVPRLHTSGGRMHGSMPRDTSSTTR